MTLLDVILVLLLLAAVSSGWRAGLLARAAVWLGLAVGVVASAWTVPPMLDVVADASTMTRFATAVGTFTVTVSLLATAIGHLGRSLGARVARTRLRGLDHGAGALAGLALVAITAWLVLPVAAELPGTLGRQAADAGSTRLLAVHAPRPPDVGEAVRQLVADSNFPEVIAELGPAREAGPPPDDLAVPPEVLESVTASTVRVSARGCGMRYDGSGATIAPDTVVTNAHVVAGSDEVEVRRPDGVVRAGRVVAFDPDRDLALVSVADLGQQPLSLGTTEAGESGAVVGYPGGQPEPRIAPVGVDQRRTALGRDIYGLEETDREVLFLAGRLRQGDSGAPVISADGRVVGVVFAVSPDRDTAAYALDRTEVDAILAAPRVTGATGRCLGDVTPSS